MTTPRKTIDINTVRKMANDYLRDSCDDAKEGRIAIMAFVENILLQSKQYKGYGYLTDVGMLKSLEGTTVGIRDYGKFDNTDNTRISYF